MTASPSDELPDPSAEADGDPTVAAVDVRPPLRAIAPRWAATLGAVGVAAGAAYLLGSDEGRGIIAAQGTWPAIGGWVLFLVGALAGGFAGLAAGRGVSSGQRMLRRREVLRHVLGESLAAGVGATVGAFLGALAWNDVLRLLAFTLALATIFTWAVLMPASSARFEEHAGR